MRPEDWLAAAGLPPGVAGGMSCRAGGVSQAPFESLNLRPAGLRGDALDDPLAVIENQRRWAAVTAPARPVWLDQVHGAQVVRLGQSDPNGSEGPFHRADAAVTTARGVACTVLVADCLPVLLADRQARAVAAAHAGWRGLAAGVLENTLAELCRLAECGPGQVHAWLGACIGPSAFEVGDDVRDAFGPGGHGHFRPTGEPGKWWADLPALARQRLCAAGVRQINGGQWCTASEPSRFFSFRRDRVTGRHAASIWRL